MKHATQLDSARDPTTPEPQLAKLARSKNPDVIRAVALNPNAGSALLSRLASRFPAEVVANPAFPLVLIENPGFLQGLNDEAFAGVFAAYDAWGESVFDFAVQRRDVRIRKAVACHPRLPERLYLRLLLDLERSVACLMASYACVPRELVRAAERFGAVVSRGEPAAPAPDPTLTAPEIAALTRSGPIGPRLAAHHPNTDVELLRELAREDDPEVLRALASRPSLPDDLIATLAACKDSLVRSAIARRPGLSRAVQDLLIQQGEPHILEAAARNESTDPDLLERLATSPSLDVRGWVAGNPSTAPAVLEKLARDDSIHVRVLLATNRAAPPAVLAQLALRALPIVAIRLAENHATPPAALERVWDHAPTEGRPPMEDHRLFLARALVAHPATPARVLAAIARETRFGLTEQAAARAAR